MRDLDINLRRIWVFIDSYILFADHVPTKHVEGITPLKKSIENKIIKVDPIVLYILDIILINCSN